MRVFCKYSFAFGQRLPLRNPFVCPEDEGESRDGGRKCTSCHGVHAGKRKVDRPFFHLIEQRVFVELTQTDVSKPLFSRLRLPLSVRAEAFFFIAFFYLRWNRHRIFFLLGGSSRTFSCACPGLLLSSFALGCIGVPEDGSCPASSSVGFTKLVPSGPRTVTGTDRGGFLPLSAPILFPGCMSLASSSFDLFGLS